MSCIVISISIIALIASGAFGTVATVLNIGEGENSELHYQIIAYYAATALLICVGIAGILSVVLHA